MSKTLNLNTTLKDVAGNPVSIATLQRSIAPAYITTPEQQEMPASYALLVFAGTNAYRAQTADELQTCYSILRKVNEGIEKNVNIELTDIEYNIVLALIDRQVIAIRAPFHAMVTELNPA